MTNQNLTKSLTRLALAAFFSLSSSVFAGYVYQFENTSEPSRSVTLSVQGNRIRVTTDNQQGSDMIFDASKETMLLLQHDRKRYVALDKEAIADLALQLEDAMAEMEQQLADLPPAQRQMVENMMKGQMRGMGEAPPKLSIVRTDETSSVSGYTVRKIVLLKDGSAASELWVADWDDLEGSKELMSSMQAMAGMYDDMVKAFSQGPMAGVIETTAASNWFSEIDALGGMPILSIELDSSGNEKSRTTLSQVTERELEPIYFEIPKGYKKQKMKL